MRRKDSDTTDDKSGGILLLTFHSRNWPLIRKNFHPSGLWIIGQTDQVVHQEGNCQMDNISR